MRMLSSSLALDASGKFVIAYRAPYGQSETHRLFHCHLCGCPVVLLNKEINRGPRFEHDTEQYPAEKLRKCSFYDGKDKDNKRLEHIRKVLRGLRPVTPNTHWYCVMCQRQYEGAKCCDQCCTGIYSIANAEMS